MRAPNRSSTPTGRPAISRRRSIRSASWCAIRTASSTPRATASPARHPGSSSSPRAGLRRPRGGPLREILRRLRATFALRSASNTCTSPGASAAPGSGAHRAAASTSRASIATSSSGSSSGPRHGGGLRALHAHEVRRHQALRPGGCRTVIPLLDLVLERAGGDGVEEAVIGMAHRGRLNVLANTLSKVPSESSPSSRTSIPSRSWAAATSSTTWVSRPTACSGTASSCTCPWRSTRATSRPWTRWSWAACAPSSGAARTRTTRRCSGSCCTATPRLRARAWWARSSTCPTSRATGPAARCTSSSTTRSASRPHRPPRARRPTPRTSPR